MTGENHVGHKYFNIPSSKFETFDFSTLDINELESAITEGITEAQKNIDSLVSSPDTPTFENTILALETADENLDSALSILFPLFSGHTSDDIQNLVEKFSPILAQHSNEILLNPGLFKRVKSVFESEFKSDKLNAEQKMLLEQSYKSFVKNGANLSDEDKKKLIEIDSKLSVLSPQFSKNVLGATNAFEWSTTNTEDLKGLPESAVEAAKDEAKQKELPEGTYSFSLQYPSLIPMMKYNDNREIRKTFYTASSTKAVNGEFSNQENILEVVKLRYEKATLLGFKNHAEFILEDRMAKTPENAMELMNAVWPAAIARVKEEVADMQAVADANGDNITIEPWDYRYYAEKVRKEKYDLDSDEVKQYLQLDKLTQAMFYVAGRLFNYDFNPVPEGSVPVFQEDVKVWEVTDKDSGEHIGLWYLDPYARTGKRSGAWATMYRNHNTFDGKQTVLASNNSNFVKPAPGQPVLVSWDDATTFFHEFGHALHFFSSNVRYPTLNGGVRDYTEFQSQLLERWLSTDEVINQFLVHHETGEVIPAALVEKIKNAATFNQGFATTEYLASALIDMELHLADPTNIDIDAFEREKLAELNMPKEIVMRHRTPHFGHVFSGEGYATAYYGYMWADVLTSDAAEAFNEAPGGFYDAAIAEKLVKYLFAPRNAIDPADAYRSFRGRDAKIDALMRDRGFPVPSE